MNNDTRPANKWNVLSSQTILACLVACSVIINILLASEVKRLKNNLRILKSESQLAVGTSVPPIDAKDIEGNSVSLSFHKGDPPTVLYIFTPQCDWCTNNLPNIKLLANMSQEKHRFVGLSLSNNELREYVSYHKFEFPVYKDLSFKTISSYMLGGTPQTLIVSDEGKVLKNWTGAYSGSLAQEIEEYFGVTLPGLIESNTQKQAILQGQ